MIQYMMTVTPNAGPSGNYERLDAGNFVIDTGAGYAMQWRVFNGHNGGGMTFMLPADVQAWWPRVCRVTVAGLVDVLVGPKYAPGDVLGGFDSTQTAYHYIGASGAVNCYWKIPSTALTTGQYYVTTNIHGDFGGTHGFHLFVTRNNERIPDPEAIVQQPPYMPTAGGFPYANTINILPWKGFRNRSTPKAPTLVKREPFTAEFVHNATTTELFYSAIGNHTEDFTKHQYPYTTPFGGIAPIWMERYSVGGETHENLSRLRDLPKDINLVQGLAPRDTMAGDAETGSIGGVFSAYECADLSWMVLSSNGGLFRVKPDRSIQAIYGWSAKPGTPQPLGSQAILPGIVRDAYLEKHFTFAGSGREIARAFQICERVDKPGFVLIAEAKNHVLIEVEIATGIGTVFAGSYGVGGSASGAPGTAKFNQPRGVCQIRSGQFKNQILLASEHGSEIFMIDPLTGSARSILKAPRVPTIFGQTEALNDFKVEATYVQNRTNWCAPIKIQPLPNAQFCHPTQMQVGLDGETVYFVTHDSFRVFKLDLTANTLELFYESPTRLGDRPDAMPINWPTLSIDRTGGATGIKGALIVAHWHYNSLAIIRPDGTRLRFVPNEGFSLRPIGSDGPGANYDAYPRAFIPGEFSNTILFSGTGANHTGFIGQRRADDPVIDPYKFSAGKRLFMTDRLGKASLYTTLGYGGFNHYAQFQTPAEMEIMSDADWLTYMKTEFGDRYTVDEWALVRYYIRSCCPLSVNNMRIP